MATDTCYAVAIVGSGPAGLAAAAQAAARGLPHILLERGELANTVHRYRKHKHVMAEPRRMSLHEALPLEFSAGTREEVLGRWHAAAVRSGIHLARGPEYELVGIDGESGDFTLRLRGAPAVRAQRVVLAIGTAGSPRRFGVPGEGLPHVHYHVEDLARYSDGPCIVVGAGDSAIEEALALLDHDADVTLLNRGHGYPRAKGRNRAAIESAILGGQLRELRRTTVERFEPYGVWLRSWDESAEGEDAAPPAREFWVDAQLVVGCLGSRQPRRFLESLGLEFRGRSHDASLKLSPELESSRPGVYVVGALAGQALIKQSLNQGYEVIERLLGHPVVSRQLCMLRQSLAPVHCEPEQALERMRKQLRLFQNLAPALVQETLVESQLRRIPAGALVYARGEFSESLWSVVEGAVELAPAAPESAAAPRARALRRAEPGDFFGLASVLSGRPRTEHARAAQDSLLLETPAFEVRRLMRADAELAQLLAEEHALRVTGELFPQLSALELRRLVSQVVHESHAAGAVIFREGAPPDGLHILLRGSALVLRERAGRQHVINCVRAGEYFGELALVHPARTRSATVKTAVPVETLRIPAELLRELGARYPSLHAPFERRWQRQIASDERVLDSDRLEVVDFLMAEGGKEATDLLVIDEALCIRCDNCERACAETHGGFSRLDREAGPRFAGVHLPTACQHCENPLCMTDCPPGALQRHPSGEVYILDTCIGCGNCASECPYDVIKMQQIAPIPPRGVLWGLLFGSREAAQPAKHSGGVRVVAVKCDLCREVPGVPEGRRAVACVSSCPTGAIARRAPDLAVREILDERGD